MHKNLIEELNLLLQDFDIAQNTYAFSTLTNGLINDTYLITIEKEPKYILQRINHLIFTNIEGLMQNITLALPHLNTNGYAQINVIKTKAGHSFLQKDGNFWRLISYINQSTTYNTTTSKTIAFEAGRIIGTFHTALQPAELDLFIDTIPKFHNLKLRENQFKEALANAEAAKKAIAKDAIKFTLKMLEQLNAVNSIDLPVRICHNDTKLNNILFSKETQKGLCLIDLDTIMKGYFYFDFGDAVRSITNAANEDEKDLNKITFDKNLFEAFINGLDYSGIELTKTELETLSLGAVVMPFLHGIRALTDYLNNNKYYKVSYENQNLDRALSLFDYSQKAYLQLDFMNTIIANKLH